MKTQPHTHRRHHSWVNQAIFTSSLSNCGFLPLHTQKSEFCNLQSHHEQIKRVYPMISDKETYPAIFVLPMWWRKATSSKSIHVICWQWHYNTTLPICLSPNCPYCCSEINDKNSVYVYLLFTVPVPIKQLLQSNNKNCFTAAPFYYYCNPKRLKNQTK